MSWFDWLGYVLLAVLAISFIVLLPLVLRTNLIKGHAYREKLAVALNKIPLGRMLTRLNLSEGEFLHQQSSLEINKQISRCQSCDVKNDCTVDLEKEDDLNTADIGFCPNQSDLEQFAHSTKGNL